MNHEKKNFLLNDLPRHLKSLDPATKGQWGKMNVQQMIEHLSDSVREANGKIPRTIVTVPERLVPMKEFLMSEKEFRPNTKNVLMGDDPYPVRNPTAEVAIQELENELKDFEKYYTSNPELIITNPFFGHLDYAEWTQLLHKHAVHHLKQFGVNISG